MDSESNTDTIVTSNVDDVTEDKCNSPVNNNDVTSKQANNQTNTYNDDDVMFLYEIIHVK